jgi:hypothetical protein
MTNKNIAATLCVAALIVGCTPGGGRVLGVYSNPENTASVEFMPDGKAHFSVSGLGGDCTYAQSEKTITLTCEGESTQLTVGDDGALTGPPEGLMSRLKKS